MLPAKREQVWEHCISPQSLNREFFPFLRMTFPKSVSSLTPENVPIGEKICRSWILLFGILPVEYDDVCLVSIDPGKGFLERSVMLTQKVWEHERRLEDVPGGVRVTDRVEFSPRLPFLGALNRPLFHKLFQYRHWRLGRLFS